MYVYVRMYICMYVCMYVCVYVPTCVCMYVYIQAVYNYRLHKCFLFKSCYSVTKLFEIIAKYKSSKTYGPCWPVSNIFCKILYALYKFGCGTKL